MIKKSRTQNYIRGLASGYVVILATIIVGLWLTPFTLRFLDREEFAIFTLAGDVLIWLGLLEIGLTAVLNVKAAQQTGKPNQQLLDILASTTFFAQIAIALLLLFVGSIVTIFFPDFFGLRPDLRTVSMQVMGLMVLGSTLTIASQTFSALLVAYQQIHIDNVIRLFLICIRTAVTVGLLTAGYGLLSLALANLTAVFITSILSFMRVRRLLPGLTLHVRNFSWQILRETAGKGIWFSLGGVAGILIMSLDRVVTAKIVSVEMVTTFTLTNRLYLLAWSMIQQVTGSARPAIAQIVGEGNMGQALIKYRQFLSINVLLALSAAGGIFAINNNFVGWWVGIKNYGGVWLDFFFALNLILNVWVLPSRTMTTVTLKYVKENSLSRCYEGIANLILSLWLGSKYGIAGVAAGTTVTALSSSCWYLPKLVSKIFNCTLRELIGKPVLHACVGLICVAGVACVFRMIILTSEAFFVFFSLGLTCTLLCIFLLYWIVIGKEDKMLLVNIITRMKGKVPL